ncbi:hypothetical protein Gohar_013531, partial [Gossypium harknessii]|nr:hypothetical protein [Gossypium harknessii]
EAGFWHVANIGWGASWTRNLSARLWRGGDTRLTHSIFYVGSVPSLWRTCSYSWGYWWMGPYSSGPLNLLIGEPYVTIFGVRFQILFTEVGLI